MSQVFDPGKHPRNTRGEFAHHIGELAKGGEIHLPGGIKVTKTSQGHHVVTTEHSTSRHTDAAGAADRALEASAKSNHPDSLGGAKSHTSLPAALKANRARARRQGTANVPPRDHMPSRLPGKEAEKPSANLTPAQRADARRASRDKRRNPTTGMVSRAPSVGQAERSRRLGPDSATAKAVRSRQLSPETSKVSKAKLGSKVGAPQTKRQDAADERARAIQRAPDMRVEMDRRRAAERVSKRGDGEPTTKVPLRDKVKAKSPAKPVVPEADRARAKATKDLGNAEHIFKDMPTKDGAWARGEHMEHRLEQAHPDLTPTQLRKMAKEHVAKSNKMQARDANVPLQERRSLHHAELASAMERQAARRSSVEDTKAAMDRAKAEHDANLTKGSNKGRSQAIGAAIDHQLAKEGRLNGRSMAQAQDERQHRDLLDPNASATDKGLGNAEHIFSGMPPTGNAWDRGGHMEQRLEQAHPDLTPEQLRQMAKVHAAKGGMNHGELASAMLRQADRRSSVEDTKKAADEAHATHMAKVAAGNTRGGGAALEAATSHRYAQEGLLNGRTMAQASDDWQRQHGMPELASAALPFSGNAGKEGRLSAADAALVKGELLTPREFAKTYEAHSNSQIRGAAPKLRESSNANDTLKSFEQRAMWPGGPHTPAPKAGESEDAYVQRIRTMRKDHVTSARPRSESSKAGQAAQQQRVLGDTKWEGVARALYQETNGSGKLAGEDERRAADHEAMDRGEYNSPEDLARGKRNMAAMAKANSATKSSAGEVKVAKADTLGNRRVTVGGEHAGFVKARHGGTHSAYDTEGKAITPARGLNRHPTAQAAAKAVAANHQGTNAPAAPTAKAPAAAKVTTDPTKLKKATATGNKVALWEGTAPDGKKIQIYQYTTQARRADGSVGPVRAWAASHGSWSDPWHANKGAAQRALAKHLGGPSARG